MSAISALSLLGAVDYSDFDTFLPKKTKSYRGKAQKTTKGRRHKSLKIRANRRKSRV